MGVEIIGRGAIGDNPFAVFMDRPITQIRESVGFGVSRNRAVVRFYSAQGANDGEIIAVFHVSLIGAYYDVWTFEDVISALNETGFINTGELAE